MYLVQECIRVALGFILQADVGLGFADMAALLPAILQMVVFVLQQVVLLAVSYFRRDSDYCTDDRLLRRRHCCMWRLFHPVLYTLYLLRPVSANTD